MIRCPKCGKDNAEDCAVCYHCLSSLKQSPDRSAQPQPAPRSEPAAPATPATAACPACGADNDVDAAFCDQCGLSMSEEPEGCPDCGGEVQAAGDGKGVCTKCGAQLSEQPSPTPAILPVAELPACCPAPADLSRLLSGKILQKLDAGMALELAVQTSCEECLSGSEDPAEAGGLAACPVCGTGNPPQARLCRDCGISFSTAGRPIPCPRCTKPCSGDTCACGAIMTLPKLLSYVDDSVSYVCPRCKHLLTVKAEECPTCAGNVIPADRLKACAAEER